MTEDRSKVRAVGNYCHDRMCVPCQQARARDAADAVHAYAQGKLIRFATLTIRHSETPLAAQIKRIYTAFKELRRRTFWKDHVKGGVFFFELKLAQDGKLWHPHLHLLIETDWLPQKELAQSWHEITGDSFIVDVRSVPSPAAAAGYVAKYAGKSFDSGVYAIPAKLDELICAIHGVRTHGTFGTWRNCKLHPKTPSTHVWLRVGRLDNFLQRARHGEEHARRWIEALFRNKPETPGHDPPETS